MKGKIFKRTMQVLGAIIIAGLALFSYKGNKSQEMPAKSTLKDSQLAICGEKPNCVSSFQDVNDEHYIEPLAVNNFSMDQVDTYFKECKEEQKSEFYRYYTCTSRMFKFVDDIEILLKDSKLYFRSASRVGHSDLGANRKRIDGLIKSLKK